MLVFSKLIFSKLIANRGCFQEAVEWPGGLLLALVQNHAPAPAFDDKLRAAQTQHEQSRHSEAIATVTAALAEHHPLAPLVEAKALKLRAGCYRGLSCAADAEDDLARAAELRNTADEIARVLAPQVLSILPAADEEGALPGNPKSTY